ncbi:MAG: monooxygenase [Cyanobacteria bacterium M_DeepCast_100m_m1_067]|nr:monooxygenase [Cyanobacteria bacterium M_DeepCast_100m_m1_067]
MNSGPRVVVVGAGPAGASLALLLARSGVAVTLVEASSSLARQFRGEALMPSGLEALAAMGLTNLLETVPHRPLQGWRFVLNGCELFHANEPLGGDPQRPCTLVNQPALLEALLLEAQGYPSFALERGEPVSDLLWDQGRVAGVRLRDGRHLEAELVVACDGRASLVRQKAGLALVGSPSSIDLLWFQLACPSPSPLQGRFTTLVGPEGVFSAFDSAGGGVQLGWVLGKGERVPACSRDEWIERMATLSPPELAAWLRQWRAGLGDPSRLAVQVGLAERWWAPGLLLLGDAAHPMSPVRAQGINMALRDAWVASAKLLPLLRSALQPPLPSSALDGVLVAIEAERRPEISALQALQAAEAARGDQLRRQNWLRSGLALAAPVVGPAIAAHWSHQQQPLRQGLSALPMQSVRPGPP